MKRNPLSISSATALFILGSWAAAPARAAAPIARDDFALAADRYLETISGVETYSLLIDVLANDEDADGDPLEVVVQGDFGLPPAIWTPSPVGTVQYLGGGLFELSFGKEELGDATEVTFQYELEGAASLATVRVAVAGEGPAPEVKARDDTFTDPWSCWIPLPVLANDTGLDVIQSFTQPTDTDNAVVERHPADPQVLVYRGAANGTFTYVAASSVSGETAQASVSVEDGNVLLPKSDSESVGEIIMADCFDRDDWVILGGEPVAFESGPTPVTPTTWTAPRITHLSAAGTIDSTAPGGSSTRRKAYLPFDADVRIGENTAFQLQGTFLADPNQAEWVALAFTHGSGSVFTESDLWVRLDVETGELFLNGRWDDETLQEKLGSASPAVDGYPFVSGEVNHLSLRYDTAPAVPRVDVWMNGVRVFSRINHADVTASIENAGFFINYGPRASDPGDVWFDDFELWVGDVNEATLFPKSGDPVLGTEVENGSTVELGPLHVGCTPAHLSCHSSRETSIWLTNEGNQTLEVSHLSFEGPTEWRLVSPSTTELSIPPGQAEEIVVRVEALEVGETASRLELTTNDPDMPKLVVSFAAGVTQAPVADFVHYCTGLTCSFDSGPSTGEGLNDFSFAWQVDGAFDRFGPALTRSFATSGVHSVELRVVDATEAEHRVERTVSIPPEAAFTFTCANATRTCDFDAAATSDGAVSFLYRLGDGTAHEGTGDPGDVILRHTYATSGRYDVTLTVRDADGQEASVTHEVALTPIPDFLFQCSAETQACDFDASLATPQMTLYEWSFGDGSQGTGLQSTHTYATSGIYSVVLTVIDPAGQVESIAKPVAVPPRAEFSVACDPEARTCTFDGSASTPGVSYAWDFGDGTPPAEGAVQEHTYATSGIFSVTLTVIDPSGQAATHSRPVALEPVADFSVRCDSLVCQFDAGPSTPGVTSYAWNFGHSGATGTGVAPLHEFPDAGEFDVSLTVTDGSGQIDTTTKLVTVFNEELLLLILLDER